ncbi:MAG TPA: hypothetical protein G4N95_03860 [Anaerolineae bacterium]|nr:hypothetical protein [Anaerolineae bacterium]
MKGNKKLGVILAIIGILTGLLILYLLVSIYNPTIVGKINDGRPDEAITVQIVFAILGWLGLSAGAIWGAVLYGFLNKQDWAWFWGLVAATIQILAGFFPIIPPASINMPTPTVWVFLIAFILWFGMLFIGGVEKKIVWLAFASGLAYVFSFIDGVGAISRFQTVKESFPNGMYALGQMVNWWGAAAWAVFIFVLVKRKTWIIPMGIFAALMTIFGGLPVGLTDVIRLHRFSMFLPSPLISIGMLIYLLLPGTKKLLKNWVAE